MQMRILGALVKRRTDIATDSFRLRVDGTNLRRDLA